MSSGTSSTGAAAGKLGAQAARVAAKNPQFMESFTKTMFQQLSSSDEEVQNQENVQKNTKGNNNPPIMQQNHNDNSIDVDPEEFEEIKKWHRRLRATYIGISTFLIITALLSFVSLTVITSGFIAFYVLLFSCLMCCFELGSKWFGIAKFIVQNFGFLYNSYGRMSFFIFLALLSWSLGIMGKVSFAILLCSCIMEIYIGFKHPKFGSYQKKLHYFQTVTPRVTKGTGGSVAGGSIAGGSGFSFFGNL